MSILIIFRKRQAPNRFHELIINSLLTGAGNNALICSGFFQEDTKYSASRHSGLCCALRMKSIRIETIGIHNAHWKARYKQFRNNIRGCGNPITAYISKRFRWHAKIYILKKGNEPILGIIGSSNMTRPAFDLSSPFNFEADVVLWDKNIKEINDLCEQQTLQNDDIDDVIFADYNLQRNRNQTAMEKLRQLEVELRQQNLTELEE